LIRSLVKSLRSTTVDSLLTHSDRWTPQAMGYEGVWGIEEDCQIVSKLRAMDVLSNVCKATFERISRLLALGSESGTQGGASSGQMRIA
jgi:hypothetical protein